MSRNKWHILSNGTFISRKNIYQFVVLAIILIASTMRIKLYGNPNLSIAGNDTPSYVESSQVPLFSSEMMTGRRLLTTNLLYKFFEPKEGYQILANGSISTIERDFQPGFNNIAVTQLIVSILGWGFLALSVSENIKNPFMKILSAVMILLFAFTPQMADWDSILLSESLTFSMFALHFAILIKLVFFLYKNPDSNISGWFIAWIIVYFLWNFVRVTNVFTSLVTFVMISGLLVFIKYRRNKYLYIALLIIAGIFVLGTATTGNSVRSLNYDVYYDDLLSEPARVAILEKWGMPSPNSQDFQAWFEKNSTKTLIRFMFSYPGYPAAKIIKDFPQSFTEIKQTYFKIPWQGPIRGHLMTIGNAVHPENTTPFLMDLILLCGLVYLAIKNRVNSQPWAWVGVWLFLTAGITLILAILGDTWGLNRHALFSTMIYRMFMWVFSIIIIDIAIEQSA
jgi:hypothetical protein